MPDLVIVNRLVVWDHRAGFVAGLPPRGVFQECVEAGLLEGFLDRRRGFDLFALNMREVGDGQQGEDDQRMEHACSLTVRARQSLSIECDLWVRGRISLILASAVSAPAGIPRDLMFECSDL